MIIESGHFALVIALGLASLQSVLPLWRLSARSEERVRFFARMAQAVAWAIFVFTAAAFAALTYAYAVSDFSVINVWENSHSRMPFLFKLTGVWGNHEGSILLWALILALFGAASSCAPLPPAFKCRLLAVQAWLAVAFVSFTLFASNPFLRQAAPFEGRDLNPVLQDIGLALHPPMLYLGYVGYSVTFAFAIAALMEERMDGLWAYWVRPWILTAWICLTAGIALGSYWAYYELGWGGWWFWDPVENASLLPWLTGTALLHCALVVQKREALKIWTLLLAIVTFSLALLGTFLVRSGVLTSVHSFALDPSRGLFILAILCLFIGGSLFLFSLKSHKLMQSGGLTQSGGAVQSGGLFMPLSREGALVFNNLLLCAAASSVLLGTLYPLIYESLGGGKVSVGAPFFNLTFGPLMIPLLIIVPVAPLLAWKKADLAKIAPRLYLAAFCAFCAGALCFAWTRPGPYLAPLGIALAVWVMVGSCSEILMRAGWPSVSPRIGARRLALAPLGIWASFLAHFGLGIALLGIVSVSAFENQKIVSLEESESARIGDFTIVHKGRSARAAGNFQERNVRLSIKKGGETIAEAYPALRLFPVRQSQTSEAALHTFGFSQLYITLGGNIGESGGNGGNGGNGENGGNEENGASGAKDVLTLRLKPLVLLIWLGPLFMVLGGCVSLSAFAGKRKKSWLA